VAISLAVLAYLAFEDRPKAIVRWTGQLPGPDLMSVERLIQSVLPQYGLYETTVTSARRTSRDQARIMLGNFTRKGENPEYLRSLYRNKTVIEALLSVPYTVEDWTEVIDGFAKQGIYVSSHQTGKALDFRVRDLSAQMRAALVSALAHVARLIGGRILDEGDHIHLEW